MPVGAVGEGEAVETGEIAVTNVGAVDPTEVEIIVIIVIKIKTPPQHLQIPKLINKLQAINLTKRGRNIQICPPVLAGPVPSTGKKAAELHTVQIR